MVATAGEFITRLAAERRGIVIGGLAVIAHGFNRPTKDAIDLGQKANSLHLAVIATITSKGQITIPVRLRRKFHLQPGDQLVFDEAAPTLTARRAVNPSDWQDTIAEWQQTRDEALESHPWGDLPAATIIDDLRGGPADSIQPGK